MIFCQTSQLKYSISCCHDNLNHYVESNEVDLSPSARLCFLTSRVFSRYHDLELYGSSMYCLQRVQSQIKFSINSLYSVLFPSLHKFTFNVVIYWWHRIRFIETNKHNQNPLETQKRLSPMRSLFTSVCRFLLMIYLSRHSNIKLFDLLSFSSFIR